MLRVVSGDKIADTLQAIDHLRQPVSRSCHIGNNGNYNFAWLALARNTRFVMYDHTTYGADRVCFPWMLVRDYGIIDTAFDIDGQPCLHLQGKHVDTPSARVPVKHRSILNYGIKATVDNTPLFAYHYAANCELARRHNNNKEHTFDARELLVNFHLCEQITRHFARMGTLDMLFDRWVVQRRGRVLMERIRVIRNIRNDILVTNTNGQLLFRGDIQALIDSLHESLNAIVAHITKAVPLASISYPWFNLIFSYLFGAAIEYGRDSRQTSFFHAGGLTSPYYTSDANFRHRFAQLANCLQISGFLPQNEFSFNVVPIACCQLYACSDSLAPLEELILCAREALHTVANPAEFTRSFQQSDPDVRQDLMAMLLQRVRPSVRSKLRDQASRFNSDCPNRIPVCFKSPPVSAFTKYGVGGVHSRSLRQDAIIFPRVLFDLTWSEGEWVVQALGHLFAHLPEDPGAVNRHAS